MAKDPAFLFYSGDFIAGVSEMTMEERGQYITLLCFQHGKGHLSLDFIKRVIPGVSEYVLAKFIQDEEGLYYNERLEYEAEKRRNYSESRRNNRKKKDMLNISETYVQHMENENINININDIVISNDSSIVLSNKEQSLQKKSSNDVPRWKNVKIGTKVTGRDHCVMPWDDFIAYQQAHERRSCEKLDAPLVYLSEKEYFKLKEKYISEEIVKAMIRVMSNWKGKSKFQEQRNLNDYMAIDDAWVLEKAEKELRIINGKTVQDLRKREAIAKEYESQYNLYSQPSLESES